MMLSIIVPVYNSGLFLSKCIESLLVSKKQFNAEFILVNDGSKDNSLQICLDYESRHEFVRVIDITNSGPSTARNKGLEIAKGDYICFVDSDDYVEENYFDVIFGHLNQKFDILIFGFNRISGQQVSPNKFKSRILGNDDILDLIRLSATNMPLFWFPWTKVYKSSLIEMISFNKKINIGEDTIFNIEAFVKSNQIIVIDQCLYNYVNNENSLTQVRYKSNLLQNMEQHFKSRLHIHKKYPKINDSIFYNDIANYYVNHILFWMLSNSAKNLSKTGMVSELKSIRNSDIYSFSFQHFKFTGQTAKKKILIILFKYRFFNFLSMIYKNV